MKNAIKELKDFLVLWSTQSLSQLGSAMTGFALTLWLYEKTGSALKTALLTICSYAPYVIMSIFAGALSDRWNKKRTMLVCDTLAAICTVAVFVLLKTDALRPAHLYILNAVSGLMNTVQQPAGDVAITLIIPSKHYQRTSGLRSFSQSLVTILNPLLATSLFSFAGMDVVIAVDLATFVLAFTALLFFVRIPEHNAPSESKRSFFREVGAGLEYLNKNRLVLTLIFFLAGVNLVSSAFNATLPALILPRETGGEGVLGLVSSCAGIATLIGSVIVTLSRAPRDRVRVIFLTMLFSLGTENFLMSLTVSPALWCIGQAIGWILVPLMSSNLDVIFRTTIPTEMQGRVYSCRNTFQFFTIPIGNLLGGYLVDNVYEPLMAAAPADGLLTSVFGSGKGSGAAMMMFTLGLLGVSICLIFRPILKRFKYTDQISES